MADGMATIRTIEDRVASLDWPAIEAGLDEAGHAVFRASAIASGMRVGRCIVCR